MHEPTASAALASLCEHPERTALITDFDGTLSAIVDHPDDAVPLPGAVDVLGRLVDRFGVVGIVSGRPVAFLRAAVPVAGLMLVGQYGMEHWDGTDVIVDERTVSFHSLIADAAERADAELDGVYVERKGQVAVTLHWRQHAELGDRVRRWADRVATKLGLVTYPTKMAVEIRPPIPVDKGRSVGALAVGLDAAMFAGDDFGDISAFDALDELRSTGALRRVVRVAAQSAEVPPALLARADLVVDGPTGVVDFLTALADAVSPTRQADAFT